MNLDEFAEFLRKIPNPVILLEGARDLPVKCPEHSKIYDG
jgi:hypothetical protein